ncbi:MAG: MFS transporter [Sphingomonadales bacterium]|nr:MFS transporter [Sphingomonadales bacterium]
MLYMTQELLKSGAANRVWGMAAYRSGMEALFGPMSDLGFASQTYGIYAGFIYVTPLAGAWIADSFLGKTRTVCIGALLMSAGHLAMAVTPLFLVALGLLIAGGGCVIGNLSSQVGDLYSVDDARRTRAFAIFLIASSVGSLLSPLITGTLGERVGWHWGFGAAGIGMLVGAATYLSGRHLLPARPVMHGGDLPPLSRADKRNILAILLVFVPYILVNTAYQQCYALMLVWADGAVNHTVLGWEMPITWMNFFDGVMAMGTITASAVIWQRMGARGREPHDITKIGIGCAGVALAFVYAAGLAMMPGVSWIALVGVYFIIDWSCAWFEPPTGAITSRYAPYRISATMMGLFKLAMAFAYFALGWLGHFIETMGPVRYWLLDAGIAASGAVLVLVFGKRVQAMLDPSCSAPPTQSLLGETQIHAWPDPANLH